MKVSLDLRFAHLTGGGRTYVNQLVPTLIRSFPQTHWRLYHNSWSPPQQRLIEQIRQQHPDKISDRQIEFRPVRVACSNRTAIPEVGGDTGRLFDPYAIDSIAQAITAALENDLDNPHARQACLDQAQKFS